MTNHLPTDLPSFEDIPDRLHRDETNRYVYLSHTADDQAGELRILDAFARFSVDGGVSIVSSTTTYIDGVAGDEPGASVAHQLINISHEEMTKLAKAWFEWLDEVKDPDSSDEPTSRAVRYQRINNNIPDDLN